MIVDHLLIYTFEKSFFEKIFNQAGTVLQCSQHLRMNNLLHFLLLSEVSNDFCRLNPQDFGGIKIPCANLRQIPQKEGFPKLFLLSSPLLIFAYRITTVRFFHTVIFHTVQCAFWTLHCCGIMKNVLSPKFFPWNQLFNDLFSKYFGLTKFLP